MTDSPENPGATGSPAGPSTPPPFQPVATTSQPAAAPAKPGGSSALKIILIVFAVLVCLGLLGAGVVGYGVWRVSRAIHANRTTGEVTINTPNGPITANSTQKFTEEDLGTAIYPGAEPGKGSMRMNLGNGPVVAANYLTSDSMDKVVAFYKDKLGTGVESMEVPDGAILTLNKSKQDSVMLTITQKPDQFNGKTQIHIMHTVNNKAS